MRTDLIWRAALPVAAGIGLLSAAPRTVTGALALVGLALAAERLTALRAGSLGDRVLVGVGGLLVALVLTGVGLDAVGVRLRPASWAAAVAGLALVGLAVAAVLSRRPAGTQDLPPRAHLATAVRALPWTAVAVLVTLAAVRMSAASLSASDAAPLQMSFGAVSGTSVQVVVTTSDPAGPLELRTSSADGEVSYPLIDLPADGSRTTTVALPATGRFVVTLNNPDQTQPLRSLVLDR